MARTWQQKADAMWDFAQWDTIDLRCWLSNYRASLAVGANVGQIQRDRAEKVSLELIRRGAYDR